MNETMYLMRKWNQNFPNLFPQDVIFLDDPWSQLVDAWYKTMVSEKKPIKNWKCPEELLEYCWGLKPLRGHSWPGAKFLYAPFNVASNH